jgi:hypothetical protein
LASNWVCEGEIVGVVCEFVDRLEGVNAEAWSATGYAFAVDVKFVLTTALEPKGCELDDWWMSGA